MSDNANCPGDIVWVGGSSVRSVSRILLFNINACRGDPGRRFVNLAHDPLYHGQLFIGPLVVDSRIEEDCILGVVAKVVSDVKAAVSQSSDTWSPFSHRQDEILLPAPLDLSN